MLSITLCSLLYLLVHSLHSRKGNALKKIISKIGLGDLATQTASRAGSKWNLSHKMPPLLIGGCSTDIIARNSPPIKLSANPSYGKEPIKRRLDFKHSPLWKYLPRKVFFLVLPCCSPSRFPFQLLLFLCWGCMWCWVEGCCYCSLFTRFSRTTSEAAASTRRRTTGKWRRGESSNR